MEITIQVHNGKPWDRTDFIKHFVNNRTEAIAIAYAVSAHTRYSTVRMIEVPEFHPDPLTIEFICKLSGAYIQSHPIKYE